MASILSNLIKNLTEGIHKIKSKHRYNYKKVKLAKLNTKIVTTFLNTQTLRMI